MSLQNCDFFAIDAPPSYEQLFGVGQMKRQVEEAKQDSSNRGVFAAKVCEIFCGSSNCIVMTLHRCESRGPKIQLINGWFSMGRVIILLQRLVYS